MYCLIGIVLGILINNFIIKPIEAKIIQKELKEKRNSV